MDFWAVLFNFSLVKLKCLQIFLFSIEYQIKFCLATWEEELSTLLQTLLTFLFFRENQFVKATLHSAGNGIFSSDEFYVMQRIKGGWGYEIIILDSCRKLPHAMDKPTKLHLATLASGRTEDICHYSRMETATRNLSCTATDQIFANINV